VLTLDPEDLHIIDAVNLYTTDTEESHSTCLIEKDDLYYIFTTKYTSGGATPEFNGHIFITKFDEDLIETGTTFEIGSTVDPDIDDVSDFRTSVAFNVVDNDGDLLIGAEVNRNDGIQSVNDEALVHIYRIHTGVSPEPEWDAEDPISVVENEETEIFRAYDLKVGIANTDDGGYVICSTLHDSDLSFDDPHTYYPGDSDPVEPGVQPYECVFADDWTYVWNSDAYIAKFNSSDVLEWRSTYPITDGYGDYFPNDIKRLECVYEILQTDDGGFIVAGNNSKNFDDDLVIKVYNDCSIYSEYTGTNDIDDDITISTNTTWNSSRKVKGIVSITAGHSLTITGSSTVIEFADSKAANFPTYIVVERGAKLQIEGGAVLTGNIECGTMWDGIFVYGTNGTNQPSASTLISNSYFDVGNNHGVVRVITDGTIQNARYGIFAGKKIGKLINTGYGGGIVISDDAHFINNTYGIYFSSYNKGNKSVIYNTEFTTDDLLIDEGEEPTAHIALIGTKSVQIRGCDFANTTSTDDYPDEERGKGIYSFNSFFTVDDNNAGFGATGTGSDPNNFADLTYGIYAIAEEVGANNIAVRNNVFDNNFRGYYLAGSELSETTQNTFYLRAANTSYGLYLNECDAYGVEENIFTKDEADLNVTIGMIIKDGGIGDNVVYKNSFSNIKEGSIAFGENGDSDEGLVFKCGDYATSWIDIGVVSYTEGATTHTGTVNPDQGECLGVLTGGYLLAPANNLFTDPTNVTSEGQFFTSNDVDDILYVFFEDDDEDATPFARPKEYSSSVELYPPGTDDDGCGDEEFDEENWATDYCPTNFGSGGGGRMANPGYSGLLTSAKNKDVTASMREEDSLSAEGYTWAENTMLHTQLRYYVTNGMNDSIIDLLEGVETPLASFLQSGIEAGNDDFEAAELYLAELENETATEHGYNAELLQISLQLQQDTLSWSDMDSSQMATIRTLAIENDHAGVMAQHILCHLNGTQYREPIPVIDPEQEEIVRTVQAMQTGKGEGINIYPNPVSGYGIIQVNLDDDGSGGMKLYIADITGIVVYTYSLHAGMNYIEVNNQVLNPGVYIAYVKSAAGDLNKQFIVVE